VQKHSLFPLKSVHISKSSSGVTFIEFLIVVTIDFGVLAAHAIPGYIGMRSYLWLAKGNSASLLLIFSNYAI
jgi:Tfp pilus assembly protein PilE